MKKNNGGDIFDDMPDFDDGSHGNYLEERDRMLAEFEQNLLSAPYSLDYDEEEWIMLADYASDVDNFYLFSEAVMRGLVAFPDSPDLNDRRYQMLDDTCAAPELYRFFTSVASRPDATKTARMYQVYYTWLEKSKKKDSKAGYRHLCRVLFDSVTLSDFEIIEAVKLVDRMDAIQLLFDDLAKWERNSEYNETLWNELTNTAFDIGLDDIAAVTCEKLVSNFPFNFFYWVLKSRIFMMKSARNFNDIDRSLSDIDEAINSIETALAIDPRDKTALALQIHLEDVRMNLLSQGAEAEGETFDDPEDHNRADDLFIATLPDGIEKQLSAELLRTLVDSQLPKANYILSEWVKYQCRVLDNDVPDENFDDYPDLYNVVDALYVEGRYDVVDFMLSFVELYSDIKSHPSLFTVRFLRFIDKNEIDRAEELFKEICRINFSQSPNTMLLARILNTRRKAKSDNRLNRLLADTVISGIDKQQNLMAIVDPVIIQHLLSAYKG